MKRMSLAIAVVVAIAASYALDRHHAYSQKGGKRGRHVVYYVDPMHPAYKSDKPGIAPDCGMQLEPVYAEDVRNVPLASPLAQLPAGAVSIDGATQRLLGIRLAPVESGSATRTIRVVGRVLPEDTRVYRVNSGAEGFIRETYNDSVGVQVQKDQKLATYYGPEFLAVASGSWRRLSACQAPWAGTGHGLCHSRGLCPSRGSAVRRATRIACAISA